MKPAERNKQITRTLVLSVSIALGLAGLKFAAGLLTHSMAVIASALDSLMDAAVSFANLIAAREAARPPDEEHTYGHGKIESLAGLFQSALIGLGGLYLVFESGRRLVFGTTVETISAALWIMTLSIAVTLPLTWRIQRAANKTKSLLLATEKLHFTMDILTNGGVILALVLVDWTGHAFWDLAIAILVSLYIFQGSLQIFRRSIDELLDRSLPLAANEEIQNIIRFDHPSIVGIHNFRSRQAAGRIFLDFHIEIRGEENFERAHDMTESLIAKIQKRYPAADVTVHFDPEGADERWRKQAHQRKS